MLVKVARFVFPMDFVILDLETDDKVPLILGRPFLSTTKALIYVFDGKITLRVGDENVTFDVIKSMRHPSSHDDSVYLIDSFISHMDRCLDYICGVDLIGAVEEDDSEDDSELPLEPNVIPEVLVASEVTDEKEKPSEEAPPSLELKELPPHIEYAFLD
ncbi:MAG: hypothetical protein Q8755_03205, partial [Candidatus Phytoplasma australasiaticum]|nr:hypothetical protein [Candidatus Phytoplasma australasiaticum]